MREIERTTKFKKDYKKVSSYPSFKKQEFQDILVALQSGQKLDPRYKMHRMTAQGVIYQNYYNIHVRPNIIMICDLKPDVLTLVRIGSHNDLGITESINQ